MNYVEFAGDRLQEKRESLGLSRAVASAVTHVPVAYIEALETCDFSALPSPTYVNGFIISYCRHLELQPEPFVEQYRLCVRGNGRHFAVINGSSLPSRPAWFSEAVTWGTICAILLLGWVTYSVVVRPLATPSETRVEAGTVVLEPPIHYADE